MIRVFDGRLHRRSLPMWWRRWSGLFLAVAFIIATRASRLMSGGMIPASTGRNVVSVGRMHPVIISIVSFSCLVWCCGTRLVMHTQRHCRQGQAHPSAASRGMLPSWSQPDSGGDILCRCLCSGDFLDVLCTSGTGRKSHQGKPSWHCSEEEYRSQLHLTVDVFRCCLCDMLSLWP